MILTAMELTNFRCFESLSVSLHRYVNVFVGGNGSGKSTILDAIGLALAPILSHLPFEKKSKRSAIAPSDILLVGEDRAAPISHIVAHGKTERLEPISWVRTRYRDLSSTTRSLIASPPADTKELYRYLDRITDAHNENKQYTLPVFAYYGTDRAVNVPHNRLRQHVIPKYFRRLAGLDGALDTKTDFRRSIGWFDFLEQRELRAQRDREIEGPLTALDSVREAVKQMVPDIRNPRIDGSTGRFAVDVRDPNGNDVKLHLDQLSDGYQVMLGVVMDFALRLALANPPERTPQEALASEAILVIDEIDLHLHPEWQQRVIADLRRTFPNTQLILSTHSPQVLSTVKAESIRAISQSGGVKVVETPLFQTRGVDSADVLAGVMNVDPVPRVEESKMLHEYRAMISDGTHDSPQGRDLRDRLVTHFGAQHPVILDCDRLIRSGESKRRTVKES